MEVKMILIRPARKSGGDRYEAKVNGEELVIYWPQTISRKGGEAKNEINITIHD